MDDQLMPGFYEVLSDMKHASEKAEGDSVRRISKPEHCKPVGKLMKKGTYDRCHGKNDVSGPNDDPKKHNQGKMKFNLGIEYLKP